MNKKTNLESKQKRNSLKQLKNVGISSAIVASSMGAGWVRPVIAQVDLPDHATCTSNCCGPAKIEAVLGRCSGDGPVDIEITSVDGSVLRIDSVPTIKVSPTPNDWGIVPGSPDVVPAEITDTVAYTMQIAGSVDNQRTCYPPTTDVPNGNPELVTSMIVTVTTTCVEDGSSSTLSVDILPMLEAP